MMLRISSNLHVAGPVARRQCTGHDETFITVQNLNSYIAA
jgi:hypothetical protein